MINRPLLKILDLKFDILAVRKQIISIQFIKLF